MQNINWLNNLDCLTFLDFMIEPENVLVNIQ